MYSKIQESDEETQGRSNWGGGAEGAVAPPPIIRQEKFFCHVLLKYVHNIDRFSQQNQILLEKVSLRCKSQNSSFSQSRRH